MQSGSNRTKSITNPKYAYYKFPISIPISAHLHAKQCDQLAILNYKAITQYHRNTKIVFKIISKFQIN